MSTRRIDEHHHGGVEAPHVQLIGAVLLIALGLVFLGQKAGILEEGGNWWVIFLVIPGLGLLWSALSGYQKEHAVTQSQVIEIVIGIILILLTLIFIFDPNWSFLGSDFRSGVWDRIWRFAVLGLGLVLSGVGLVRRWMGLVVFGVLVAVAGVVFIFDISWDYVWPLALIIPGIGLLYNSFRRPTVS
jgi:hypothetical protein